MLNSQNDFTQHYKLKEIIDLPLEIINELNVKKLLPSKVLNGTEIGYSTSYLFRIRKGKIKEVTEIIEERCIDAKQAAQMLGCTPKWITVLAVKNPDLKSISFLYKNRWYFLKDKMELIISLDSIKLKANAGKQLGPREKQPKQVDLFQKKKGKTRKINDIDAKIIKNFIHNSVRITNNTEDKCRKAELFRLFNKVYRLITGDNVPFSDIIFNKHLVKHYQFKETESIYHGSPHRYWVLIQIDKNLSAYTNPVFGKHDPPMKPPGGHAFVSEGYKPTNIIEVPVELSEAEKQKLYDHHYGGIGDSGLTAKMHEAESKLLADYHQDQLDKIKPVNCRCTEDEIKFPVPKYTQAELTLIMMEKARKGPELSKAVARDWLSRNGYTWWVNNIEKYERDLARIIICCGITGLWIIMILQFMGEI